MDFDSEFGDENLLDDCGFDEDDVSMASMLIPAVELNDEPSIDGGPELCEDPDDLLYVLREGEDNEALRCKVCGKGFKRKSHLQRHVRLHTGEQPYACSYCNMRFARSERRNQHIVRAHPYANKTTPQPQASTASEQKPPVKPDDDSTVKKYVPSSCNFFLCGLCDVNFGTAIELRNHMSNHSKGVHPNLPVRTRRVFNCEHCPMEFNRYDHMIRHQTVHSGTKSYQCRFCEKYFTRSDNRTKHEKSCRAVHETLNTNNEMPSKESESSQTSSADADPLEIINVSSILEQDFGEYEEDQNNEDLFDNTDMFDDIDGEPETEKPEAARKTQNEADEDLFRLGGIRQRIQRPRLTQEEIDTLTCNVCEKTLTQKYHLVRHKLIHMGDQKPYKCTICGRTFARRENLKHHLLVHKKYKTQSALRPGVAKLIRDQQINNQQISYQQKVAQNFSNQQKAVQQLASTSAEYKPMTKPVKKKFEPRVYTTLREKMLLKFELYAIKYRQDTSNAIFFHDFYEKCFNFMGHMFMENKTSINTEMFGEPPAQSPEKVAAQLAQPESLGEVPIKLEYPVDDADEIDDEFSDINNGIIYNADETVNDDSDNKNECNVCQAVFPSVSHLRRHLVQHTGEKAHHCELCGRDFTRAEHKKRHMMAVHLEKQAYECEICCKRFSRSDHMVSHFRVHHAGIKPYTCKQLCGERFDSFREKLAHTRGCKYIPPNPDSPDREGDISDNEFLEPEQSMEEDFDGIEPGDYATSQFQNHFIKTEKAETCDVSGYEYE